MAWTCQSDGNADWMRAGIHVTEPKGKELKWIAPRPEQIWHKLCGEPERWWGRMKFHQLCQENGVAL
jgi:hypothetical protein